jgi:ribonuclease P protein component
MKRRMREAARLQLNRLETPFSIVFNPRKAILQADRLAIEREVERLFLKCANS